MAKQRVAVLKKVVVEIEGVEYTVDFENCLVYAWEVDCEMCGSHSGATLVLPYKDFPDVEDIVLKDS